MWTLGWARGWRVGAVIAFQVSILAFAMVGIGAGLAMVIGGL